MGCLGPKRSQCLSLSLQVLSRHFGVVLFLQDLCAVFSQCWCWGRTQTPGKTPFKRSTTEPSLEAAGPRSGNTTQDNRNDLNSLHGLTVVLFPLRSWSFQRGRVRIVRVSSLLNKVSCLCQLKQIECWISFAFSLFIRDFKMNPDVIWCVNTYFNITVPHQIL